MPKGIRIETLVVERCPYGCPSCAEEARERQAKRDLIMDAQAELFDESVVRPASATLPLEREHRAA